MPLDDLATRDGVDVDVYVPKLMDLVGRVDGVLYMLPFYNYSMAVIYRQDLIDDPAEQAAFKEKYGIDLRVPETWDEYWKQVQFFTRDNDGDGQRDFYGTVIQGQRGDCISMQWANYLYSQGGRYHDENWNPLLDSPEAIRAMEYYRDAVVNYSPAGSEAYCFDEAFNVMAQGRAYSFVTFNILYAGFEDPESSTVAGKVGIAPNPGGGLNGGWGWAIPNRARTWKPHGPSSSGPNRLRSPSGALCSAGLRHRRRSSRIPMWWRRVPTTRSSARSLPAHRTSRSSPTRRVCRRRWAAS